MIKPGILTITTENGKKEAALHAGFAQVLPDQVTILAEVVEWPEEIDEKRAYSALERAQERLKAHKPDTDMALSLIHIYVFCMLTMTYISDAIGDD